MKNIAPINTQDLQDAKTEILSVLKGSLKDLHKDLREDLRTDILNVVDEKHVELLDTINVFATHIESEVQDLKSTVHRMDLATKASFAEIHSTMATKADVEEIRRTMATKADLNRFVTKEYLDDKLADLQGNLIVIARKQNKKFSVLIEELVADGKLKASAAKVILAMEPFPS